MRHKKIEGRLGFGRDLMRVKYECALREVGQMMADGGRRTENILAKTFLRIELVLQ